MNGDITRSTFEPTQQYTGVRHQQGRVVLDADLNEQTDIQQHDVRQTRIDVIGRTGAPIGNAGFEVAVNGGNVTIGAGRFYLDGIRVEWPQELDYEAQAHAPVLPTADGIYLAVLHIWERPVDAISDPHIQEVALGGPDTALRDELVARVELLRVTTSETTPTCATVFPEWGRLLAGSTTRMQVRLATGTSEDPCSIPEDAGYRGLENQLYRFEVHTGNFDPSQASSADTSITPSFKWSRENAAAVAAWTAHNATLELTVDRLGPGGTQGFAPGQTIEITDDGLLRAASPGLIATIADVGETTLVLDDSGGTLAAALALAFTPSNHPRVRRWDGGGVRPLAVAPAELGGAEVTADGWIRIEAGIEVQFDLGAVRSSEAWLLPARTAALAGTDDRQLDWPIDSVTGEYALRAPDGPAQHYARLAVLRRSTVGGATTWALLDDCRALFPPLTQLPETEGCGEVIVSPTRDVAQTLLARGIAVRNAAGALVPDSTSTLRLCFRPGDHIIGNLAFSGWQMLTLGALGSAATTLRGRLRVNNVEQFTLRDVSIEDRTADGQRISAGDDEQEGVQFRWRTRLVEARDCQEVHVEHTRLRFSDPRWALKDGQALHVHNASDVVVRDNSVRVPRGQNGIRVQDALRCSIDGNRIEQDWAQAISLAALSQTERAELTSWVGRLLVDIGVVGNRASYNAVSKGKRSTGYDREAIRYGISPAQDRSWTVQATTLGFVRTGASGVASRSALASAALTLAEQMHASLRLVELLPRNTSTSPNDLGTVRLQIEREFHRRRAALARDMLSGATPPPAGLSLRARLVDSSGRWVVGLGGTGIRIAGDRGTEGTDCAFYVSHNWIGDFAVGVEVTVPQEQAQTGRIQSIHITENTLRLRSPLIPVQRSGIIAGGARRIRVDGNDVDIREGSSHGVEPGRGWFVGVDGIRIRGSQGPWLGVRDNQLRGCAVGIRRAGGTVVVAAESPALVRGLGENAFMACDVDTIWFSS